MPFVIFHVHMMYDSKDILKSVLSLVDLGSTIYNHSHNILRLSDVLPNFALTTSETMHYYYL